MDSRDKRTVVQKKHPLVIEASKRLQTLPTEQDQELMNTWETILRLDKVAENFKGFYREVELWWDKAPLPKWAKEDLKEMLDDHKEVK